MMRKDLTCPIGDGILNIRSGAVILYDGKLLCSHKEDVSYDWLPGGRIKLHESSEEALHRELSEELGMDLPIERLLFIHENFFTDHASGQMFHEICFYYLICEDACADLAKRDCFIHTEADGERNVYRWVDLAELCMEDIRPAAIAEAIETLPAHPIRIVTKE